MFKWNGKLDNKKRKKIILWAAVIFFLILFVWIIPLKNDISVCIEYSREYDNNFAAQIFWRDTEDFSEEKSSYGIVENNRVELVIGNIDNIRELRLDPANVSKDVAITSIQIKNHGIGMEMLPMRKLFDKAVFYSMEAPKLSLSVLYMKPLDNDPMIVMGNDLVEEYFKVYTVQLKVMLTIWLIIAGMLVSAVKSMLPNIFLYTRQILDYISAKYDKIIKIILGIAVCLVIYMAFYSYDYAHPDENMSKAAVDYYINHWAPADIRMTEAADSFSTYGHSRLSETTIYYFLAGKVAGIAKDIFGLSKYYRAFNVLLFVVIAWVCFIKGKKNPWLYLMVLLTPQIWYIFSYTTSDAWDYFLCFLILYQLTASDSIFRRAVENNFTKKLIADLVILGIAFGMLLLGKKNYYFIFVASFLLLLYQLLIKYKNNIMYTLIKYGIIAIVCVLNFGIFNFIDTNRYEGNKVESLQEQREKYVSEAVLNDIESVSQANRSGISIKEQGIGLKQTLTEFGFLKYSYQSFAGKYGWMEYESSYGYYVILGILYGIGIIILVSVMIVNTNKKMKLLFCLLIGLNIFVFGTSLWHSWTSDFQPQGRYLFAMNFNIAICSCLASEFWSKKSSKLIMCGIGGLAIYSFLTSGIIYLT